MSDLTGRELDAAVARELGWTEIRLHECADPFCWGGCPEGWIGMPPGERLRELPAFSTDIAWAMRAYGVMHERGWRIDSAFHSPVECSVTLWHAVHGFARATVQPGGRSPDAVLAEAICRAILAAGEAGRAE